MISKAELIKIFDEEISGQEIVRDNCRTEFGVNFHQGLVFGLTLARARIMGIPSAARNPFQTKSTEASSKRPK